MELSIDHHIVAAITIFGMVLDVLGALYLAYELLGGKRGPLRRLTEIMTFEIIGVLVGTFGALIGFTIASKLNLSILAILGYYATLGGTIGYGAGGGVGTALGYGTGLIIRNRKLKSSHHKPLRYRSRVLIGCGIGFMFALMTFLVAWLGRLLIHGLTSGIVVGIGLGIVVGFIYGISAGAFYGSSNEEIVDTVTEATKVSIVQPKTAISTNHRKTSRLIFMITGLGLLAPLLLYLAKRLSSNLNNKLSNNPTLDEISLATLILATITGLIYRYRKFRKRASPYQHIELINNTLPDSPLTKLRLSKFDLIFTSLIGLFIMGPFSGVGYWIVYGSNLMTAILVGSLIGMVVGLASGFAVSVSQHLDVWVENLPERRMGVFGTILILTGFAIQTSQYWISLFDIRIRVGPH